MKNSFIQNAATHGLIIGLALVVLSLLDWALGFYGQKFAFSLLTWAAIIAGLIWAATAYRRQTGGFISYGQAFGYSLTVAAVYAVITAIFGVLLTQVIDPHYMETVLALAEESLLDAGMPSSQVDMAMEVSSKFSHPAINFISSILSTLFVSAIIALVTSAIVKRVNPNPFAGSERF
ncbi:MAG: DUF4199 domain-containing protein [Prevotellaceae bacterium]|jgi:hypothetical protein|nr:DUF4199 domain-containing protein [Prevotellaceae bacterium]